MRTRWSVRSHELARSLHHFTIGHFAMRLGDRGKGSRSVAVLGARRHAARRAGRRSTRVKSAYEIKYKRIQGCSKDVGKRYVDSSEAWAPGTLGVPTGSAFPFAR